MSNEAVRFFEFLGIFWKIYETWLCSAQLRFQSSLIASAAESVTGIRDIPDQFFVDCQRSGKRDWYKGCL